MRKVFPIAVDDAAGSSCDDAEAFALMVLGDSMAPEFNEGEIVIIEPAGEAHDGSYVLANPRGEWIFRQLRRAGTGWQLAPLNPAYEAVAIADLGSVRGVIIQKSIPGRRKATKRYVE